MQQTVYLHSRSSSPTMRPISQDANVSVHDPEPYGGAGNAARPSAQELARAAMLAEVNRYGDGSTRFRRMGESFTTVVRDVDYDALPLEHAHKVLDTSYTSSFTVPTQMLNSLKREFGRGPIMSAAQKTSAAIKMGTAGKAPLDASIQTMNNAVGICENLQSEYRKLVTDAKELLAAHEAGHGSGSPAVAMPLNRILARQWPDMRFKSHAERSAWMARTMRDPKPFVAQSYDALDLAFGEVLVATSLAWKALNDAAQSPSMTDDAYAAVANQHAAGREAVAETAEAFTDESIPLDDQMFKGHSLVAWSPG